MSRRRLPPLNALRAFEAAARHLSFEKAGDEIAVTASAVGQQVKSLEAWLGRPLFVRQPSRGVVLTPLGERYATSLSDILDRLDEATAQALRSDRSNVITVSSMPSFASGWLIPRLGSLKERHPELEVRVSVDTRLTDFAREDVDVVIRFGQGNYPGLRADLLMEEFFFAVCSASLLNDPKRPLREPADLRHHTLIHETVYSIPDYTTWDRWLAAIGVEGVDTSRGPSFPHTYLCLQAAAAGQGVALATSVLIGDYLQAGRLVQPFLHQVKGAYRYYVVCPEATADRPAIAAFRAWLLDEARLQGVAEGARQ
ncbi:transcriptional regulator GcvA [Microvirga sp. BT689]|uniref:transcriptional regulator GcvA n=1 Tax=Microvirga arvi TaxID=2778731 RepID=UPI00194FD7AF|nr:transcriptional regulator GcvA [Microvirga arvi]MBM6580586.1 transcriptional regulator GcvA [Microvirga arvi]